MCDRTSSEISTHSSLELLYSDVESITSHLSMSDINMEKDAHPASPVLTLPMFPTELADVDFDKPDTPPQLDPNTVASRTKRQEVQVDIATLEQDAIYFCETVVLVAEDRVFCVPKGGLLKHGTHFQSLFGNQPHNDVKDGKPCKGTSSVEQCPIVLEGISKIHFHNFLRVIYPFYGVDVPSGDEQWLGILDLATRWGFQEVRETALIHIEHLFTLRDRDPIYALFLCRKYDIHKYIKQQFEAIITPIKPLDISAMLDGGIDTDTALLLTSLSNRWMRGMLWGGQGSESSNVFPRRMSARKIVEDHFATLDPRPMLQNEKDLNASWIQDEAKWLEDEVSRMKEAERNDVAVGYAPDEQRQPAEDLMDDKSSGASKLDQNVPDAPDDTATHIQKLILLHRYKHEVAELVQELKEKGVDDADLEMQSLQSRVEEHDRKLQEYWEKVISLPVPQTQTKMGSRKTKQVPVIVDLGGYDAQTSLQKVEQTIQAQLHPSAQSMAFSIRLGRGSINSQIRRSVIRDTLNRFSLHIGYYDCDYDGVDVYKIERTGGQFGSWLESFRTDNNL